MKNATQIQRRILITVFHCILVCCSLIGAFLLRFDFAIPTSELRGLYLGLGVAVPLKLAIFALVQMDRGWWKYSGISDLRRIILANAVASVALAPVLYLISHAHFPRSIYFVDALLCLFLTAGSRFFVRTYKEAFSEEVRGGHRGAAPE